MAEQFRVLGIIPARGGSKGIKNKNIVPLQDKPLIAYTIEAAAASKRLSRCVVSSDSLEIIKVCKAYGADVPFVRPAELAGDETPTMPVILHALDQLAEEYDAIMILQPTSPFRTADDIDSAIELLDGNSLADSVISVVRVGDNHPARMKRLENGYLLDPEFAEESEGQRRQDLPELYLRNGAVYLTRTRVLLEEHSFKGHKSLAYVMPGERSVNIDSKVDLLLASVIMDNKNDNGVE